MGFRTAVIAAVSLLGCATALAKGVVVTPSFSTLYGGLSSNDGVFAKRSMLYLRPAVAVGYELSRVFVIGLRADVSWAEQLSSSEIDGSSNLLGAAWSAGPYLGVNMGRIQLNAHYDPLGRYYPSNPTSDAESLSFEDPKSFGLGARYRVSGTFFAGLEYVSTVYQRIGLRGGESSDGQQSFSSTTQIKTWSVGLGFGMDL